MSVAFASARPRGKGEVTQQTIQKMLDENHHLIQCILDHQSKGKTAECAQYQQILHRNLVYLATIADSNQNMQSLLPAVSAKGEGARVVPTMPGTVRHCLRPPAREQGSKVLPGLAKVINRVRRGRSSQYEGSQLDKSLQWLLVGGCYLN